MHLGNRGLYNTDQTLGIISRTGPFPLISNHHFPSSILLPFPTMPISSQLLHLSTNGKFLRHHRYFCYQDMEKGGVWIRRIGQGAQFLYVLINIQILPQPFSLITIPLSVAKPDSCQGVDRFARYMPWPNESGQLIEAEEDSFWSISRLACHLVDSRDSWTCWTGRRHFNFDLTL